MKSTKEDMVEEEEKFLDEVKKLLEESLNTGLTQMVFSNSRNAAQGSKVKVRPVLIKQEVFYQATLYKGAQVFHQNYNAEEMLEQCVLWLEELFRQGSITTDRLEGTILISKKGKATVKVKRKEAVAKGATEGSIKGSMEGSGILSHNRAKQYILMDGTPVDFLVGLGVQTPDGRVNKTRYDKFRQINRYLEFIEDVLDALPKDRTLRIIDFGCGKSYLTFAMYYYLHELQKRDIQVTGLDLKEDVIDHCNQLAGKLHYEHLHFEKGDISTYGGEEKVDMVVSLHACDKATDYALEKAVKWNAEVILAVPCCQHELNRQIQCKEFAPVFKYGIIKERMAALLTDALRANLLEQQGYETQILEFIDLENTPKNLLIRAVRQQKQGMKVHRDRSDISRLEEMLHVTPTLEQLLK